MPWSAPPTMTLLVAMTTDVALGDVTPFSTVPRCCKIDLAFLPLLFLICRPSNYAHTRTYNKSCTKMIQASVIL